MSTPAPTDTWQVVGQAPASKVNPSGTDVQEGYDVTFVTGQGHTGTVFVPLSQYRPDRVKELIAARAAMLDQVGSLTHDTDV